MIAVKIDVKKIDKRLFFNGQKSTYMDMMLMDNREGKDDFGNDGFVVQSVSKEARERGEKGPIVGNWRHIETRQQPRQERPAPAPRQSNHEEEDMPF